MLAFDQFARLRLRSFLPATAAVDDLAEWEFIDDRWVGEGLGFTQFLRLEEEPDTLRSVSLDLEDLSDSVAQAVFSRLDLPLRLGMGIAETIHQLGLPVDTVTVGTETTMGFCVDADVPYEVSCILDPEEGLVFVTILAHARRRLSRADGR
jgi:hypothetical protein